MNLSVNPRNVTVKEQEINDCPPWHRQALQYCGCDLLAVSTFLTPACQLFLSIETQFNISELLINTCSAWWLEGAPALSGKGARIRFLPSPLLFFASLFLPQMFIPPATNHSVLLPEDAQKNEKNEHCDRTASFCVLIGMYLETRPGRQTGC